MIHSTLTRIVARTALAAALAATMACSREDRAAQTTAPENTAAMQAQRDDYVNQMEKRISDLEQRLANLKTSTAKRSPSADRIADIQESLKDLREEVAELRRTTPEEWWPATERAVERSARNIEADVERRAGSQHSQARTERQSQPAGEADRQTAGGDFTARRDQFVGRMQKDIDALEQQLNNVAAKGRKSGQVEDVREELNDLREQVNALRNVNAENWWDATKNRLDRTFERIEKSIENAGEEPRREQTAR